MEKRDIVFHTQTPGAPLTVVKTGKEDVPESTLNEAAQFAVSYSSLWKAGHSSGDCYWIKAEQVTKTPESGEYVGSAITLEMCLWALQSGLNSKARPE